MGWAERGNQAAGLPRVLASRLSRLRIVVDVQHLWKPKPDDRDRGALYQLRNGSRMFEADAVLLYAAALTGWLRARGAQVITNEPARGILVGYYPARNRAALGCHAYLACHLNAARVRASYAALEYVDALAYPLADAIGTQLVRELPAIRGYKTTGIAQAARGTICIRNVPRSIPALIVEPFFGDNPTQQSLLSAPELGRVGAAIGEGVAQWWERRPHPA